ncbi:MAG: TetR/AcrR family transcriptional regulator [Acidobacteria bacterium]|nr:TetR/AcrR family transcriptional regulator [Acidobacteriota bacterium]
MAARALATRTVRTAATTAPRKVLLRSTRDLMLERGSDNVSIRDIAARAGVNLSQIYYYFGSKEALKAAVLFDVISEFDPTIAARAEGVAAGAEPVALEALIDAAHARLAAFDVMPRLMLRELSRDGPRLRDISGRLLLPRLRRLEALLRRGQRSGTVRRGPPRIQAALCSSLFLYWHLFRPVLRAYGVDVLNPATRRAVVGETRRLLRDGLYRAPRRASKRKGDR